MDFSQTANPAIHDSSTCWEQGKAYCRRMQSLAPDPKLVEWSLPPQQQEHLYCAIARHISGINQQLATHLWHCQQCFYSQKRLSLQIFAVPFAQHLNIDGLCNLTTNPMTILIDVGRIIRQDWLAAVVHEYAHAQTGRQGHNGIFLDNLTHLCLGLGLTPPPPNGLSPSQLQYWPPCQPTAHPLAFWLQD